ncbi:MAG: FlgD immunoglobulin-like domain containing protein, partial [Spirochaetota bacterium]
VITGEMFTDPATTPGWISQMLVQSNRTWDEDQNGKIDGLIITLPAPLKDYTAPPDPYEEFDGFEAEVEGYQVTGYALGANVGLNAEDFVIYLKEKPYLDTGVTPSWDIVNNTTLVDSATESYIVTMPTIPPAMEDNADPVIGYTLSIANGPRDELFIQFSEGVERAGGGAFTPGDFALENTAAAAIDNSGSITTESTENGGVKEIVLPLTNTVTSDDIRDTGQGAGDPRLNITSSFQDMAATPNTSFEDVHRLTDIGLGVIQPVYAINTETQRSLEREPDIGRITAFDGTDFLQPQEIYIESNVAGTGDNARLHFNTQVSSPFISSDNPGLWLPSFDQSDFSGIVPFPLTSGVDNLSDTDTAAAIAAYTIPSSNSELIDNTSFDFFFEYPVGGTPPLYHGRCEDETASDWYRRVRPWSFDLHRVRAQTSRVSILQNVIDPRRDEKVDLHYILEKGGRVTIQVFNLGGDLVDVLKRGRQAPGEYAISWDGRNQAGNIVARGIYYIRVTAPDIDEYRKVLVVK